jgi:mannan endo-1,4-beta-mannosidase
MRKLTITILLMVLSIICFGQGFRNFITVLGNKLMDGDKELRFFSFNVPTMNYLEDEMAFKQINPYALPTEYEMRDVLATVKEMGGQVIRIYCIPVRNKNFPPEAPTYVEGPGKFNEDAFKVTDQMLALANEYGIRIIFSLLNNWQWMGGRPNYADFRGKTQDEFWTDPQLIEDFKKTIEYTLNRKNTITGITYKDDKSILCWETGNELTSPADWTINITRYIKSLDKNHLIMDGFYAIDGKVTVGAKSIDEPSIDILSSHHYETNAFDIANNIKKNFRIINGRKPYMIGEFGFSSTSAMETVMDTIMNLPGICGGLIWSLRYHRDKGGFFWHSEPLGGGIYKAYHAPGFVSGTKYDEINLLKMYRRKAFEIQGKEEVPYSVPMPPVLLPIENVYSISWKGSAVASGYNIERVEKQGGPWTQIAWNVSDADVPYFPLFHDETAIIGKTYFYRIKALNSSGVSKESNVVGPVMVKNQAVIDVMINQGTMYQGKNVTPVTGDDRSFKEIINRLKGDKGSEIIYKVPGNLDQFLIYSFENTDKLGIKLSGSNDQKTWEPIDVKTESFVNKEKNYKYLRPKIYSYSGKNYKHIKLVFNEDLQIARVEIIYN